MGQVTGEALSRHIVTGAHDVGEILWPRVSENSVLRLQLP
jgi:hypothetical protein